MFRDRKDAGKRLVEKLAEYGNRKDVIVLALPRGGVIPGFEIARSLHAPLDVLIVRKIGFPGQPELGIGAVSETGAVFVDRSFTSSFGVNEKYIEDAIARLKEEIARRVALYRKGKGIVDLKNKTVILVDDGVATGGSMKAAIATLKEEKLSKLVIALPVAPPSTARELKRMTDEFICLETPDPFMAIGNFYQDFTQVSDEEVVRILQEAARKEE